MLDVALTQRHENSSSVLGASRFLTRPYFTYIPLQPGISLMLEDVINSQVTRTYSPTDLYDEFPVTSEMQHIFRASRSYLALVQTYQDGIPIAMVTLADYRNLVQWHIMSLSPVSELEGNIDELSPLYEPCRLALIIMGVGVIFPLPPQSAPLLYLAEMLQTDIRSKTDITQSLSLVGRKIKLWCLIVGTIAASGSAVRAWYMEELAFHAQLHCRPEWSEIKRDLNGILWLDSACELAGSRIWVEALSLSNRRDLFRHTQRH
jgi:hypothetical protein